MTTFELLKSMKPSDVQQLIDSGVMKEMVARDIKAYQWYLNDLQETKSIMQSVMNASIMFCCSDRVMFRIIKRMKNE